MLILIGNSYAQELKTQFFFAQPIQSLKNGDFSKNKRGDLYKSNEMAVSISYENAIGSSHKWLLIAQLRYTFNSEYTYIATTNRILNGDPDASTRSLSFGTQKSSLHVGVGRKFNIEKIGFAITPRILLTAATGHDSPIEFGKSDVISITDYSKSTVLIKYESPARYYLNFGLDFTKRIYKGLNLIASVDFDYNEMVNYSTVEINEFNNQSTSYKDIYSDEGTLRIQNIYFGIGFSYDFRK